MPKYVLSPDGKLLQFDDNGNPDSDFKTETYAKSLGESINREKSVRTTLNHIRPGAFPEANNVNNFILKLKDDNLSETIIREQRFTNPEEVTRYIPFNSFSDEGDDANGTYAFANLDTKYQLAAGFSGDRTIFLDILTEFIEIFLSSFLTVAVFEILYAQWKEDVRSKTDLTMGSYRQYSSMNILDNFIELLHKEANWPKTKSGALVALVTGLLMDMTNTDVTRSIKELDTNDLTGISIGFPVSLITFFANNVIDSLINSQDVFNRVKLRLRRISLDAVYRTYVKSRKVTVNTNFGFTDFVNSYYFKYIVERINVGEKLLVKYVLGDHPLGYNVDTRYLPNSALTRLAKSKKGPHANTIGNQSTSPLSLHQLESNLNVGHEIQRAIALDGNAKIKDLGSLATKFNIRPSGKNASRFTQKEVKELEDKLEAEYVPFYFQDLRNNEIMAFHAFIESISDSFNPSFNETDGYGRVESIKTYNKTTRNISINFTLAAMNPDDHDYMWFCVNRLVAMCYPQWSKGAKVDGGFTQPFSQIPTASPVIRIRLGDLFKSNYSRKSLARLFGAGDEDFSVLANNDKQYSELYKLDNLDSLESVSEDNDDKIKVKTGGKLEPGVFSAQFQANSNFVTKYSSLGEFQTLEGGIPIPFVTQKGDKVFLLPGIYPEDTNGVFQAFAAIGIKATVPDPLVTGRTFYKNNEYLECEVLAYSDSTSLLSFFGGPSDEGKSHIGYYELKTPTGKKVLASHDSVVIKNLHRPSSDGNNTIFEQNPIVGGPELLEGFMKPDNGNSNDLNIYNPIVKAFESSRGRGLAGVITQLDYNYNDSTWETSRIGSKAPQFMRVQLTFSPIHDIPLGLDHKGFMRAPAYNVGKVNRTFFGEVYDKYSGPESSSGQGLSEAITRYENLQNELNEKS